MTTNNQVYVDLLNVALSMGDLDFLINFWKLSTFLPIKEEIHDQIDAYVPDLAQRLGFVCYEKNFYHFVVNVYDQEMAYEILTTNTDSVVTYLQQGGKERAKKVGKILCTDTHYQNLDYLTVIYHLLARRPKLEFCVELLDRILNKHKFFMDPGPVLPQPRMDRITIFTGLLLQAEGENNLVVPDLLCMFDLKSFWLAAINTPRLQYWHYHVETRLSLLGENICPISESISTQLFIKIISPILTHPDCPVKFKHWLISGLIYPRATLKYKFFTHPPITNQELALFLELPYDYESHHYLIYCLHKKNVNNATSEIINKSLLIADKVSKYGYDTSYDPWSNKRQKYNAYISSLLK